VLEEADVQSFAFSQDGASWLYAYSTVKDLKLVWVLAIQQAGGRKRRHSSSSKSLSGSWAGHPRAGWPFSFPTAVSLKS